MSVTAEAVERAEQELTHLRILRARQLRDARSILMQKHHNEGMPVQDIAVVFNESEAGVEIALGLPLGQTDTAGRWKQEA